MSPQQPADSEWKAGDSSGSSHSDRFANLSTPWFTLIGEHIQAEGQTLDYWRIEKADSVVILPIQAEQLLLPPAIYRPGIGRETLDFPGGRCPPNQEPAAAVSPILQRELGINPNIIQSVEPLNKQGWSVNSSFSNQKLHGFIVQLGPGSIPKLGSSYPINSVGLDSLLSQLNCLQCRMILMEWWHIQIM